MIEKLHNLFIDWKELFRPGSFNYFESLTNSKIGQIYNSTSSWEKALFLSELCRLAYIRNDILRNKVLVSFGLEEQLLYSNKGSEFLFLKSSDNNQEVNICCYRGTNDIYDYINNLSYGYVDWKGKGLIYKGFKKSFDKIEKTISEISSFLDNKPVLLTGHSLGGVLAVLSSYYFENSELFVFGLPKIGNESFNRNLLSETEFHHFCMENDFISILPFSMKKFKHLESKIIPSVELSNITCPSKLYNHAPINYSRNILKTAFDSIYK